ncbi:hypothetical protein BU24DRAFT_469346 [Aaosphaeria arxii CBS 175.79]|uniref:DUF7924 domain-containing protein n=1 Tax=Aaosphaeria arxii CBS 175.79 TaxID=1450172 RepID=A0A6A5Y700_9PLEO|nr:uncharacterized protein BU24DRAFT_469346 [Aaosphaeria arxii CBS 175.79]KAF2020580.1 hypothetical protein BU24DRAFT_469346 [Aaosphaeria arxii CBS 175.79]
MVRPQGSSPIKNHKHRLKTAPQVKGLNNKFAPRVGTRRSRRLQGLSPTQVSEVEAEAAKVDKPNNVRLANRLQRLPSPQHEFSWVRLQEDSGAEHDELEDTPPLPPYKQSSRPPSPKHNLFVEGKHHGGTKAPALEQEIPHSTHQLSEKNLQLLGILNGEDMGPATSTQISRRTPSRHSTASQPVETEWTARTASTTSKYRKSSLQAVQIWMHVDPPAHIQATIDLIIGAEVTEQRRAKLHAIAEQVRDECRECVRSEDNEDSFAHILLSAIKALKALGEKKLSFKPSADWRQDLKPVKPVIKVISAPPRKRQRTDAGNKELDTQPECLTTSVPTLEPANKLSAMPPPAPPGFWVKTPRPDFSLGIDLTSLIADLSSSKRSNSRAMNFFEWLKEEAEQPESEETVKPVLNPIPTARGSHLTFPFAVIECKAYSTGKQIFEAENQAAVSAACGLKIQLDLDDLAACDATSSDAPPASLRTDPPLFFSICTQGPIIEIWAHWTVVEDGVRRFESSPLDSYNGLFLERGKSFMVGLNNIVVWGLGSFMKTVVKQLEKVAEEYDW